MTTPEPLPRVLDWIAAGVEPEALTDPNIARSAARDIDRPEPAEVTAHRLAIAWSAMERRRAAPLCEKRLFLAAPACTAMCHHCDMMCAVIAGGVRKAYHTHQRALQAGEGVLSHGGRIYFVPAGRA